MAAVSRLRTFVDLAEDDDGPDARRMSLAVRHEAVLPDGRPVVLLADRGWSEGLRVVSYDDPSAHERRLAELPGIWAYSTVEEIERTARVVVGPDEPFAGHTPEDMDAAHWDSLARILGEHGVEVEAGELKALPHDVELSDRVLARIRRRTGPG